MKSFDKESVHDNQIAPLMTQIIAICKEHNIPMLATFNYRCDAEEGHVDYATTCISRNTDGVSYMPDEIKEAINIIRNGASTREKLLAMAITTKAK